MTQKRLFDIVIFGGNLAELNDKDVKKQYKIAGNFFNTGLISFDDYTNNHANGAKADIMRRDYDGIIHANLHIL